MWSEKSGFRVEAVVELAQIAVAPEHRRQGIAESLIRRSLPEVEKELAARSARLKAVFVSKALGAEVEATISSLYSGDEALMVARRLR